MPFSTPAEIVSLLGDAEQVRHVYLPGLTKSYSVWSAKLNAGGYYLVTRESAPVAFTPAEHSDQVVAGPFAAIKSFAAHETAVANIVAMVFEGHDGLWVVEYDYVNQVLASGPTRLFPGEAPSLATGVAETLTSYLVGGALKARKGLAGGELDIARPSSSNLLDHDTQDKSSTPTVSRYLGLHGQRAQVSRRFTVEASTEALYESGLVTKIAATVTPYDEVNEVSGGDIYSNVYTGAASPGIGQSYEFLSGFGVPRGVRLPAAEDLSGSWSLSVWMITPQVSRNTVFLQMLTAGDGYVNIYLPWSDGNVYFDVYDDALSLSRINKILAPVPGMEHWVFVQNADANTMKIWRDGVLWHSGTGKASNLDSLLISIVVGNNAIYDWDGTIAEIALFGYEVGEAEVAELSNGLPGHIVADIWPGLLRYWKFDDSDIVNGLHDLSGNGLYINLAGADYDVRGVEVTDNYPLLDSIPAGSGITVEAWVTPSFQSYESLVVDSEELSFGYKNTGKLFFSFKQPLSFYTSESGSISSFSDGTGKTLVNATSHGLSNGAVVSIFGANGYLGFHVVDDVTTGTFKIAAPWVPLQAGSGTWAIVPEMKYVQKSGRILDYREENYVAVSHVFADEASTFMVVNGSLVEAEWIVGSGNHAPGLSELSRVVFRLGYRDRLLSWHMMSTAKTLSQIRDYAKGKV